MSRCIKIQLLPIIIYNLNTKFLCLWRNCTNFDVFINVHSPMAVATPHILITGFKHVKGESCLRLFFASIVPRAMINSSVQTNQNFQILGLLHVTWGIHVRIHFQRISTIKYTSVPFTYFPMTTQFWNKFSWEWTISCLTFFLSSLIDKYTICSVSLCFRFFFRKSIFQTYFILPGLYG